MRREIQRLHQITEASIVYVTHDQGEALAMADRIVVMNHGHIEQVGTPEEIYYQPKTSFVATFVGKANIFEGKWAGNRFHLANSDIVWENNGTSDTLILENKFALRPEQIRLSKETDSKLSGKILTKQFQGKEYHYSVDINGETIIVQSPFTETFEINDIVGIEPIV